MQALGMIETKGLLSAIEGADVMAKCADIKILERVFVGGGLVSVTICGDVAAVKMAVEAGSASIKKLNEETFISCHVIPRPSDDLKNILKTENITEEVIEEAVEEIVEEVVEEEILEPVVETVEEVTLEIAPETVEEAVEETTESTTEETVEETIEEVVKLEIEEPVEKLEVEVPKKEAAKTISRADIDQLEIEEMEKFLKGLKVYKLRRLAKEYDNFGLQSKAIAKLDKATLIEKIMSCYKN